MKNAWLGIFVVSLASLITELALIRVFDVLFYPNIAYLIITCSLFAFGLAGVYAVLRPLPPETDVLFFAAKVSVALGVVTAAILPVMNFLPFDLTQVRDRPVKQALCFGSMYISIAAPFFLTGRIFSTLFTKYATVIQKLYFWDLAGAALGSAAVIPLIGKVGPGGLLLLAGGLAMIASALFAGRKIWTIPALSVAGVLVAAPVLRAPEYFDFREHQSKRNVKVAREQGLIEKTVWDPISKIDIINYDIVRYIAYDGGTQTSLFYPFDGDFSRLRSELPTKLDQHFWQRGVLAAHFVKDGTRPRVLVIGSAGGQEIKAALLHGASHVDAVELVGAVVRLGQTDYADYMGGLFHHPDLTIHVGEGRSFLRASKTNYDIIQIFSNHTSSSVAAGTGAVATNYLQTAEAYEEYFSHLTENGILQVNHYYYDKMITTAAVAWSKMGKPDLARHVVVYEYSRDETLPTLLIKMQPWTADELSRVHGFFSAKYPGDSAVYTLAVDPHRPEINRVPPDYFSGSLSAASRAQAPIRIIAATDDRPYFNFASKTLNPFPDGFGAFLASPLRSVPLGLATLYLAAILSLFFAIVFILIPLVYSTAGKQKWPRKSESLVYFMCLGAGFIIIEFVFIQLFMRLVGSPLYTFSTVIFTMLLGAGLGSLTSHGLNVSPARRWYWPFVGTFVTVALVALLSRPVAQLFLAAPELMRVSVAALMMFPVGFFLGMPFPLGILAMEKRPPGAVAWAWGMNGLFTVIGGLLAVVFSIQWGFNITLVIACALYAVALVMFARIRREPPATVSTNA